MDPKEIQEAPPVLEQHAKSLDAAHHKLREQDSILHVATSQLKQLVTRVASLETTLTECQKTLRVTQGEIEKLRLEQGGVISAIKDVSSTNNSIQNLLSSHIASNMQAAESDQKTRLAQVEEITTRIIKIGAAVTMILGLVAMIYSVVTNKPISAIFGSMIGAQ